MSGASSIKTPFLESTPRTSRPWAHYVVAACLIAVLLVVMFTSAKTMAAPYTRHSATQSYVRVPTPSGDKVRYFVAYGQSNADCFGEAGYVVKHPKSVLQYYDGHMYEMKEPMLGSVGVGSCIWARLGDLMVDADSDTIIVFGAAAVPGYRIEWLQPGTPPHTYMLTILEALGKSTDVLFIQGESNAGNTPPDAYKTILSSIYESIPEENGQHKMHVAVATRCKNDGDPGIAAIQKLYNNGPDLDSLHDVYRRSDNCHFNQVGLQKAAEMWTGHL